MYNHVSISRPHVNTCEWHVTPPEYFYWNCPQFNIYEHKFKFWVAVCIDTICFPGESVEGASNDGYHAINPNPAGNRFYYPNKPSADNESRGYGDGIENDDTPTDKKEIDDSISASLLEKTKKDEDGILK